jgi:glycosyltransferase involved in cell wall biosynthesis
LSDKPHLIFVATRVPYPAVTGHYLRTMYVLRGLAEHFAVHFFGFHDPKTGPAEAATAGKVLAGFCASVHMEGVGAECSRLRLLADLVSSTLVMAPFVAAKYRSRTMRRALQSVLAKHEVVAAHADSLPSGQYLSGLPCARLLTNHNVEYQRLASYALVVPSPLLRLALRFQAVLTRRYERAMLRDIGSCIVVSETDRTELQKLAPTTRFFVVPNGTDASLPPLPSPPLAELVGLWVGGMDDPYNLQAVCYFASDILPRVRARVPRFRWRVVGRAPPPLLVQLAASPSSGVELAGFVENLRDEYARATIVVVPQITGGGTKLKVLEAMAMNRAVATTPVGAEGIAANDGVEMEIAATADELVERIVALLLDPGRRERMAAAARALAERVYDWRVVNRSMLAAVHSVIQARRAENRGSTCAP